MNQNTANMIERRGWKQFSFTRDTKEQSFWISLDCRHFHKNDIVFLEDIGIEFVLASIPKIPQKEIWITVRETPKLWKREDEESKKDKLQEAGELCAP